MCHKSSASHLLVGLLLKQYTSAFTLLSKMLNQTLLKSIWYNLCLWEFSDITAFSKASLYGTLHNKMHHVYICSSPSAPTCISGFQLPYWALKRVMKNGYCKKFSSKWIHWMLLAIPDSLIDPLQVLNSAHFFASIDELHVLIISPLYEGILRLH